MTVTPLTTKSLNRQTLDTGLLGDSAVMQQLNTVIQRAARVNSTVLIRGESGTGKELIATALHMLSDNSENIVAINCAAIPADLLESELFGHQKGSFTGAISDRIGHIEQANNGTLFLDEIGDMPLSLQPKLLRFLQQRTFQPVGSTRIKTSNARIVAATHQHLNTLIQQKSFRADLYYRLAVLEIAAPPLREHRDDIPALCDFFITQAKTKMRCQPVQLSRHAMRALKRYQWPGNVRELQNTMESLMVFKAGCLIRVEDLPPQFNNPQRSKEEALKNAEGDRSLSRALVKTLEQHGPLPTTSNKGVYSPFPLFTFPSAGVYLPEAIRQYESYLIQLVCRLRHFHKDNTLELCRYLNVDKSVAERIVLQSVVPKHDAKVYFPPDTGPENFDFPVETLPNNGIDFFTVRDAYRKHVMLLALKKFPTPLSLTANKLGIGARQFRDWSVRFNIVSPFVIRKIPNKGFAIYRRHSNLSSVVGGPVGVYDTREQALEATRLLIFDQYDARD